MNSERKSSIRRHWSRLEGNVHPDDMPIFDRFRHSFRLNFPPPAFIGNVDTAPIVILMANGGYDEEGTPKEFPDESAVHEHRDYLRGLHLPLPRFLSKYYTNGPLGSLIADGSAVLVNAIPYRSPRLSEEKENQATAQILPTRAAHRRWLHEEVLPLAGAGQRFVLAHRTKWWGITPSEFAGPCVLFSDPAKAEPNRRSPDKEKLEQAKKWLTEYYNNLGPDASRLNSIADVFAERFENWRIRIQRPALVARSPGHIYSEGWHIWYRFGRENEREFLDYYATHRMMWGDEHIRIHEDGSRQPLPALSGMCPVSNDPVESERLKGEYFRENREIGELLSSKGFLVFDDE